MSETKVDRPMTSPPKAEPSAREKIGMKACQFLGILLLGFALGWFSFRYVYRWNLIAASCALYQTSPEFTEFCPEKYRASVDQHQKLMKRIERAVNGGSDDE